MAFFHLFARLQLVEWSRGLLALPWEWTPPDPALTIQRQMHACSCRPFDHPKASLWGIPISFSLLSVTDSRSPSAHDMHHIKNRTKVIFWSWRFSFSILCDDLLWHQDNMIPGNTIPMYLLASNEALLACPISTSSADQDPLCFS